MRNFFLLNPGSLPALASIASHFFASHGKNKILWGSFHHNKKRVFPLFLLQLLQLNFSFLPDEELRKEKKLEAKE